ncbi:MAG: glycosyltransferase family 4 protein [Verrucomicrobia bacterium]|nr:glycosyltransferase family 4 protein [Verrucomicrobiota bacterium]
MKVALLTTDNREPFREYHKPEPWFGAAPEALLQGFTRQPELEVHVVTCTQQPVWSPDKLAPNVWFHSLHVPKLGWLRTGYQGCVRAVRRKLRDLQPDLVHGQGTERECALCAVFSGFPNVLTLHGNMCAVALSQRAAPFTYHWLAARLEDFALKRTRGVFCNSAYTENLVRPRAPRTWRVPNAVRETFFAPPSRTDVPAAPVLLVVGEIVPYKRPLELLAMARALRAEGAAFQLQFVARRVGQDDYGQQFQARLAEARREGWADWLGPKSADELRACMDAADALIHWPTEEAFGLVVAEALARNLKLFAARTGGVSDIAGGVEGVELFTPDDTAGLTQSLREWLRPASRSRPAGAATEMRARYHPDVIARRHVEIYSEALSTSS